LYHICCHFSAFDTVCTDRNLFYHTFESVKMGMSYSNRLALLKTLYRTLADYILAVAIHLLRRDIEEATS